MRYISAPRIREQLFIAPKFKSASDKKRSGRMMAYDVKIGGKPHLDEEVAPEGNRDALNQIVSWAQENLSQEEIRSLVQNLGNGAAPAEDQEEGDKTQEILALLDNKLTPDEIELVKQLLAGTPGATERPLLKDHQPAWQDKMSPDDAANIEEMINPNRPKSGAFKPVGALGADSKRLLAEAGSRIKVDGAYHYGGYCPEGSDRRPMAHDSRGTLELQKLFPGISRIRI